MTLLKSPQKIRVIQPGHVPTGRATQELTRLLHSLFQRQLAEVMARFSRGIFDPVDLSYWLEPMMAQVMQSQALQQLYVDGIMRATVQIAQATGRVPAMPKGLLRGGRFGGAHLVLRKDLATAFDLFNPRIREQVRGWVFSFCESTLATATMEVNDALAELHESLLAGLEHGERQAALVERVQRLFSDPRKAHLIAITESSRAVHGGGRLAALDSGVVTEHEWLASADCCDRCRVLADMGPIPINQPYTTSASTNAAYAIVWHPGLHPSCYCSEEFIIGEAA
jgi:hypothetical protein